jgi:protein tyrosine phosphatase
MSLTVYPVLSYSPSELLDAILPGEDAPSAAAMAQGSKAEPYAHYAVPLHELSSVAESLRDPLSEVASQIYDEIVRRAEAEFLRSQPKDDDGDPTYVQFPEQDFVLAPLPGHGEIGEYIGMCLQKDVRVMVSAHHFLDARPFGCYKFLDQEILSSLSIDGWTIQTQSSRVLAVGTQKNSRGEIPQIVETTLRATNSQGVSHTVTHLHYEGWLDIRVAPDETLLCRLIDRVQELSFNPRNPIAINCLAGRGRTFNIAAAYYFRKKIDEAHQRGEDIATFPINLFETLFAFDKQRSLYLTVYPEKKRRYLMSVYAQILAVTSEYGRRFLR